MAGKDGVLALQALWASYGPKGRLPFTQQAFDQYVHTASESIGKFIATMDTFFTWHELGGMKLSARRKCEMALQKVHANYRLTMLSTCSAYAYKWVQVKAEFRLTCRWSSRAAERGGGQSLGWGPIWSQGH